MKSLGSEKKVVLAASGSVVALNHGAGVRSDFLNTILRSAAEENGMAVLENCCAGTLCHVFMAVLLTSLKFYLS